MASTHDECLILVNECNRAIGTATKDFIHRNGLLHRAFSIFLIDNQQRILLQKRHPQKYHSGGLWANSCCGHPTIHERTLHAARRRLSEELGLDVPLRFGFFSRYQTALGNGMHENEFVYIYFGVFDSMPKPNENEVIDIELLTPRELVARIRQTPDRFTCWLKHYFRRHETELQKFLA